MVFLTYFFQSFARSHQPCAVNIAGGLECEQSLFFFRFMEENARARASSETLETTAAAREDKRESLFFHASPVSRLQSRAFCSTDQE